MTNTKPRLRWSWAPYLRAYRAHTNGYFVSVWHDDERGWVIEIQRISMFQVAICARCKGRGTALASQIFAESRLLRLVRGEACRAKRIEKALGAL